MASAGMAMYQGSAIQGCRSRQTNEISLTIASFFYSCNIPAHNANAPVFREMVQAIKMVPASHAPPPPPNNAEVDLKFNAGGVEQTLPSKIGVKQGGGILGPVLFLFLVAGFQMAWRTVRTTTPPTPSTKPDGVLDRRQSGGSEGRGGVEQVRLSAFGDPLR
jgi:hypothetical protein